MAQIFVSHSQKDKELVHFFLEAFAGTKVKPHLEEFEKQPPSGATARKIQGDIQASNAVFVLLTENVEKLPHTRDWVTWECGTAGNKEIWIFEPIGSLGKISVVVPRFNQYALFEVSMDWRDYLRSIISSYDDSHILPALLASTSGGLALSEDDRAAGAVGGFFVGLAGVILHKITRPPFGFLVKCPKCESTYRIHSFGHFRCPACNSVLVLYPPQGAHGDDFSS